jgi:predicted nucleic acid-binding protein
VILADTSAWVEFDRATGSPVDLRLTKLIADGSPIAVTEPVVMEILSGAKDGLREEQLRRMLLGFELLSFDSAVDFEGSARIYRKCRASGVTPRGLIDCMITAVAWRNGATLLAADHDLHRVAGVIGVKIDGASAFE